MSEEVRVERFRGYVSSYRVTYLCNLSLEIQDNCWTDQIRPTRLNPLLPHCKCGGLAMVHWVQSVVIKKIQTWTCKLKLQKCWRTRKSESCPCCRVPPQTCSIKGVASRWSMCNNHIPHALVPESGNETFNRDLIENSWCLSLELDHGVLMLTLRFSPCD